MEKICSRCNQVKTLENFPKDRTYCKRCWQKQCRPAIKRWTQLHRERACAYSKKWKETNQDKVKARKHAYYEENRDKVNLAARLYRIRNSAVTRAHDAVKYALKTGKLERQPCFCCGAESMAHHPSYAVDMRLSVVWLCRLHHAEVHS